MTDRTRTTSLKAAKQCIDSALRRDAKGDDERANVAIDNALECLKSAKGKELTGDAALKAEWAKIVDPYKALCVLASHREFMTDDPYYRDMNDALWEMIDRVIVDY